MIQTIATVALLGGLAWAAGYVLAHTRTRPDRRLLFVALAVLVLGPLTAGGLLEAVTVAALGAVGVLTGGWARSMAEQSRAEEAEDLLQRRYIAALLTDAEDPR